MSEEMHDILDALGIDIADERGDEIQGLCPMHEERTGRRDHNPSWWINSDSGTSICFSCGYKASLKGLVADVRGLKTKLGTPDWDAAEVWLSTYRDSLEAATRKLKQREDWIGGERPKAVPMTEARLAVFDDPPKWARKARKLSLESCHAYGVLWDDKEEAWITPLRDPGTHKLMGWQMKGQGSRLFRNRPTGIMKSRTLFGIDQFTGGEVVVVESPLDCLRLHSAGVPGALAVCGGRVSQDQVRLLRAAERIVLALDNPKLDKAGDKALREFYDFSIQQGFDFLQFAYGDSQGKDPGDMTDDEIHAGLANAKHSVWGLDQLLDA